MWRVKYYLTGGTLTSQLFPSLSEATEFVVYKICCWDVYDFYRVD
jgi:hypothetical protein